MNALKQLATITALVAEIGDCDEVQLTLDGYIKNLTELKTVLTPSEESEKEGFDYDDKGVKVRWNKETEDWDALEPYCFECGRPEGECEINHFTIENEVFICCNCFKSEEEEPFCFECGRRNENCNCEYPLHEEKEE